MKEKIEQYLISLLEREYNLTFSEIKLETPPKKDMWDIAFGCFMLARDLKKSPADIAQSLKELIDHDQNKIPQLWDTQVAWPYLNIFLAGESYSESFWRMMNTDLYKDKKVNTQSVIYIDYIWANVGKPLHIGHMCTPCQWQVLINAFQKLWYTVISDSHIWDWGIIFWKLIVAYLRYGSETELEKNAVEHLFYLYVKISQESLEDSSLDNEFREAFKKLSHWDSEMKDIWKSFTRYSIDAMNTLLSRLFVGAKYNIWESFYEWLGLAKMEDYPDLEFTMSELVTVLIEKNIATENEDGSVWVVFPESMNIPSCILRKRDGTHWYLASDLASVKYRVDNWNPKKILYFVDVRQQLHLKQVFVISRMAWWLDQSTEITHAHNGFISLKDGTMSTRTGNIIKLESLLDEAEKRASDIICEKRNDISDDELKKLSKIIWIGAIKYGYLKKARESDSVFDWDEYMSFDGNSGPYIQYAYVRAQKILQSLQWEITFDNLKFTQNEEYELIKNILWFEKVILDLTDTYHPHRLCKYIYETTKSFSSFYNNISILWEKDEQLKKSRLALLAWFSKILEESFEILWIQLPKQM